LSVWPCPSKRGRRHFLLLRSAAIALRWLFNESQSAIYFPLKKVLHKNKKKV
jgi:hypothetical protein